MLTVFAVRGSLYFAFPARQLGRECNVVMAPTFSAFSGAWHLLHPLFWVGREDFPERLVKLEQ